MEKFKLGLEAPATTGNSPEAKATWEQQEQKLMEVLKKKYNLTDEEFMCGTLIGESFHASEIRDIALLALGSDWPGTQLQIALLRFKGNGPCPRCGAEKHNTLGGHMDRDEETGALVFITEDVQCDNCKTEYSITE